ncbi:MAG TPA: hypothetical protein PKJ33_04125 [Alphaproteobacteria bacterium]|nr:hypothetical protein [Alphaproteobacteria bacterium]
MSENEFDDRIVFVPTYHMQGNLCTQIMAPLNDANLASKQYLTFGSDPRTECMEKKYKEAMAKKEALAKRAVIINTLNANSKVPVL